MGAGTYERKQFAGGAPATSLTGSLSDSATSFDIDSATGWPDATNPFVIVIDRGLATEEKCLVGARTSVTLSSITRGYDDTVAQAHSSGAVVEHVIDASTIDQANRLANLQDAKGEVLAHNGTNPVAIDAPSADEHVLMGDTAESGGVKFARLETVTSAGSAPTVSGIQRVWFDTATNVLRASDGTDWQIPADLPVFASSSARDTYYGGTPTYTGIAIWRSDIRCGEVWDGSAWQPFSTPHVADATARDAYYTTPQEGDRVYLTGNDQEQQYRQDEWIIVNRKFTVSANAPSSPHEGDIWLQPVS